MKVKIDTKEKMHVIAIEENHLTANMTDKLQSILLQYIDNPIGNVIINFEKVMDIDTSFTDLLVEIQQQFYEKQHSLVFCGFNSKIETILDDQEVLELLNITPTESEAWDIVQMEEIERELL